MADSASIPYTNRDLKFPQLGQPRYLRAMLTLKMYRRIPPAEYPPGKLLHLLERAHANRRAAQGLHIWKGVTL